MNPQRLFFKKERSSVYGQNCMMPELFLHHNDFIITASLLKFLVICFVILGHYMIKYIICEINCEINIHSIQSVLFGGLKKYKEEGERTQERD